MLIRELRAKITSALNSFESRTPGQPSPRTVIYKIKRVTLFCKWHFCANPLPKVPGCYVSEPSTLRSQTENKTGLREAEVAVDVADKNSVENCD